MKRLYEVLVGNIGAVHEGANRAEARRVFDVYVGKSRRSEGRAANEQVTLWLDGEIISEHFPPDCPECTDQGETYCKHGKAIGTQEVV